MKLYRGFSLIELLVVVAVLGVLITVVSMALLGNTSKARDARRKGDLSKLKTAFEDYYNDNDCYPEEGAIDNCNSADLKPYVGKVPCDPQTKEPYIYEPESNCTGYRLFAQMERIKDAVLNAGACFGVAVGVSITTPDVCAVTTTAGSGGTGGGGGGGPYMGGRFACFAGECNVARNPVTQGCPITFDDSVACQQACDLGNSDCSGVQ